MQVKTIVSSQTPYTPTSTLTNPNIFAYPAQLLYACLPIKLRLDNKCEEPKTYWNTKHEEDENQLNDTEVRRKLLIMKGHLLSRNLAAREKS